MSMEEPMHHQLESVPSSLRDGPCHSDGPWLGWPTARVARILSGAKRYFQIWRSIIVSPVAITFAIVRFVGHPNLVGWQSARLYN